MAHKRKLIGTVKVYATDDGTCTTYETVWPIGLYRRVNGREGKFTGVIDSKTIAVFSKSLSPVKLKGMRTPLHLDDRLP
jgi:hypothetical protein